MINLFNFPIFDLLNLAFINPNNPTTVAFNQNDLKLDPQQHQELINYTKEYGGLCDIICNRILIDDLLGSEDLNSIKNKVTIERLNEDAKNKLHILKVYSVYFKVMGTLFGIYPDNILPFNDQWSLVDKTINKVNSEILIKALDQVDIGDTLKLEVFNRNNILQIFDRSLLEVGHSMLIKKTSAKEFIFFDPNKGEWRKLDLSQILDKINNALSNFYCNDVVFINGKAFLEKLSLRK